MNTRDIENIYPLSPMQQGMLYHFVYRPGSEVYFARVAFALNGDLNAAALERAWQEVVNRCGLLRTSFAWKRLANPLQVVHRQVKLPFTYLDWRAASEAEQQEKLDELIRADQQQGFDLSQAPLMRISLIRRADDAHHFVWSFHHILLDGWSLPLLLDEVLTCYEAYRQEQEPRLPARRPFGEYIQWLQQQDLSSAEQFWRQYLKGFTSPTSLPGQFANRSDAAEAQHATREMSLSVESTRALQQIARRHKLTLNTIVQGAWALLLSRYSGQEDVVFGATVSGRPAQLAGVETMLGLFINTLPVRVQVKRNASVIEWLKQMQVEQVEMRQYEYSPLVDVQGWSEVSNGDGLFESLFVFENYPTPGLRSGAGSGASEAGNGHRPLKLGKLQAFEQSNYPLALVVGAKERLLLRIEYDRLRISDETVERMLGHLEVVLEGMAKDVSARVGEVELLTSGERADIAAWNRTEAEYPATSCVHELFAEQARRNPAAIAVSCAGQKLSYGELNERSNQVAHYLRALGVTTETRVGICVERSLAMVVGLLGILKAGGVYVPLGPEYPAQRLAFMIADAAVSVLLTEEPMLAQLPTSDGSTSNHQIVCLDRDWELIAKQSVAEVSAEVSSAVSAANLAYIIYTSGSTGEPKGVAVSHQAINRLVFNAGYVSLNAADVVAQAANSSFDAITFELWGGLLSGARVHIISQEQLLEPARLAAVLQAEQVTVMFLTTALFNQMGRQQPAGFAGVKQLLFGGQQVAPQWVRAVLESGYAGRLVHVYGPTETTTFATWHEVEEVAAAAVTIPIGKGIGNTQAYILDGGLAPVPVGVNGELYLGGAGLARGYWERAGLTAERFIPHPYSEAGGERLYRTGDVARYRADGAIEFIGRLDEQVKVRGYRIELGEIENALNGHAAVAESVVLARTDEEGTEQWLVGYLVLGSEAEPPSAGELRQYLQQQLPEYMIPAQFVLLTELPLTPNGKVDRRALPTADEARPEREAEYTAPRTPAEEILASIFQRVLRVERVGIHDNFFELGGHSLLAMQIVTLVRESFQLELPLRTVFECPTVAEVVASLNTLRQEQSGLVAPPISKVDRDQPLPLSFAQQRLWFMDQLEPESAFYNTSAAVRLGGDLNVAALGRALDEITRRHESLRTSFQMSDGVPLQIIAPAEAVSLPLIDVSHLPVDEREAEAQRIARQQSEEPFDLEVGPLLRATLVQLEAQHYVLVLVMHHIITDGWSVGILLRELRVLYKAYSEGKSSPLGELTVQYADFAHWQREWLSGETLNQQLAYWSRQLEGVPAVLELPTDFPRPPIQSFRGSRVSRILSPSLAEALKQVSQQEDVTLFMTLLAALQTLLYRYSQQSQFCIGTPIANRNWAEVEPLIGFFVNTLVLRARLEDNPTFKELLKRVRETCLGAYAHQDVPFEKLVEEMEPDRALSHTPLFQVMMTLQKVAAGELQLAGVKLGAVELENRSAKFDLTLTMMESESGLAAVLEYNTELYRRETIERMLGHLEVVLEGMAKDVSARVGEVELLTSGERADIAAWNRTGAEYPATSCVHELFAEQVRRNPAAIAVSCAGEKLSYGELHERSNQVAHYLRALGVTTETRVGICVERSLAMVVGLLGILKAGGVYVPLDPEYPAQRLAFMIADAAVSVLLTEEQLLEQLPTADDATSNPQIVCLDRDWELIAKQSVAEVSVEVSSAVSAANLAYIIYTSGSTGEPKGVAVSHQAINRLVFNAGYVSLNAADVVAQAANASFDAITFELWGGLLSGARVHIISQEQLLEPARLAAVLQAEQVTVMFLTTALFNQMGRQQPAGFAGVKQLLFGGQQVAPQWVRAVLESGYAGRLVHVYGPTETTTFATWHEVGEVADGAVTIPIGKGIGNTQAYILDGGLAPVPVGVNGELYLGGAGLARGYWQRAGLTAERFIPHPYSEAGGERLYRTGDVARYRADGAIEFIGRLDEQVKVRGYRIELGEIENALNGHAAVAESVVLARTDEEGTEQWLVGYLVLGSEAEPPSAGELRQYLQQQLPEYMIPAQFVLLTELPLTPNGKVDRRALPAADEARPEREAEYTAPRTPAEEILASIFQRVLRVERVGIHDNFFELGGHSLSVTQVISLIHKELDAVVTVRHMFTSPTVAQLAEIIQQTGKSNHSSVEKVVEKLVEKLPANLAEDIYYDLSYAQKQVWISCQLAGSATPYNVPVAYALEGELNLDAFERALGTIVARHESLRTSFVLVDDEPKQKIHDDISFKVSFMDLSGEPHKEATARRIANEEAALPFALETGPLVRARLLKLAETRHVLLLTMHHIITDGWSINTLLKELVILYQAFSRGQDSPLPPLRIQYKDFVSWQKQLLSEKGTEGHQDYWLRKLAGKLPVLNLPTDKPRPAVKTFNGEIALFAIDKELAASLYQLSRDQGATLFMTLLASLYALFYRYTGQEDIIMGSPIAGRNHSDLEDQIGLFSNLLALRASINGEQSFKRLLQTTRQNTLEAYEHQQYQLDFLLTKLNLERDAGRHGLFNAVITLQNQNSKQSAAESDLKLARFQQTVKTAEYDLCFIFTETGEEILVTINYNTDLFVAETIDSMWLKFLRLLEQVVADREVLILDLELSDEEDELLDDEEVLIELGV